MINWLVRVKNPNFWIGLVGVVLVAMGVDASMFTSWGAVYDAFIGLINNPFMLCAVLIAIWGYVQDFTTSGFGDGHIGMSYTAPKKKGE